MPNLTRDEALGFLRETVHTAHLATVRADGRPHVATIWYVLDGEEIVFTTFHTSVKGRNLQRTGYAAMSITDDSPPYTHVALEGPVTIDPDPVASRHWAAMLGGRYLGADRAEEFGQRNGIAGEHVCRLTIAKITGMSHVTD